MNVAQMRARVLEEYPYPAWKVRVGKMSDVQVFAVYTRITSKKKEQ